MGILQKEELSVLGEILCRLGEAHEWATRRAVPGSKPNKEKRMQSIQCSGVMASVLPFPTCIPLSSSLSDTVVHSHFLTSVELIPIHLTRERMQWDSRFLAQQAAHHWGWHGKAWRQPVPRGPRAWRHWSQGKGQGFWGTTEQQRAPRVLL